MLYTRIFENVYNWYHLDTEYQPDENKRVHYTLSSPFCYLRILDVTFVIFLCPKVEASYVADIFI